MIPWWLVALLVNKAGRTGRQVDIDLQREIETVAARITARTAKLMAVQLTVMQRQRLEESGKYPPDIQREADALYSDKLRLRSLMERQYRRAGGERRLEK